MLRVTLRTALGLLCVAWLACPVAAQTPPDWNASQFQMSRQELQTLLERYEQVLSSPGYSNALKRDARRSAELIRARLEQGDFRTGDRIVLEIEGLEEQLPDTIVVSEGPAIKLPGMEEISLEGVLRSELQEHLTDELQQYIREPRVRARSLIRLSIQGAVGSPGFYVFPSELLLEDIIMLAGGPAQNADLDEIVVRRGADVILEEAEARTALDQGRSLDQLGLQAGDQIQVPEEPQSSIWPTVGRYAAILASTLLLGVRLF